jgi:hypothetical protein
MQAHTPFVLGSPTDIAALLVSICLGELYEERLEIEKGALARARPRRPGHLLLDWQR